MAKRPTGNERGTRTVQLRGCDDVVVAAGSHRLVSHRDRDVQRILLTSGGAQAQPEDTAPRVTWSAAASSVSATVASSDVAHYLVVGRAYDNRWRATIDGKDAGEPVEVNGYALGWRLPAGDEHHVQVTFGPQRDYAIALGVSLLGVLGCAVVVLAGARPRPGSHRLATRRRRGHDDVATEEMT